MNKNEIKLLAESLMTEYKLTNWRFRFSNTKRIIGRCFYKEKVIEYSNEYVGNPFEEVNNTLRHEIAHALVGRGHGHNHIWKAKAIEVGANPVRCGNATIKPKGKYDLVCNNCGNKTTYHRRPRRKKSCGVCCSTYNPKYVMEVVQNY